MDARDMIHSQYLDVSSVDQLLDSWKARTYALPASVRYLAHAAIQDYDSLDSAMNAITVAINTVPTPSESPPTETVVQRIGCLLKLIPAETHVPTPMRRLVFMIEKEIKRCERAVGEYEGISLHETERRALEKIWTLAMSEEEDQDMGLDLQAHFAKSIVEKVSFTDTLKTAFKDTRTQIICGAGIAASTLFRYTLSSVHGFLGHYAVLSIMYLHEEMNRCKQSYAMKLFWVYCAYLAAVMVVALGLSFWKFVTEPVRYDMWHDLIFKARPSQSNTQ